MRFKVLLVCLSAVSLLLFVLQNALFLRLSQLDTPDSSLGTTRGVREFTNKLNNNTKNTSSNSRVEKLQNLKTLNFSSSHKTFAPPLHNQSNSSSSSPSSAISTTTTTTTATKPLSSLHGNSIDNHSLATGNHSDASETRATPSSPMSPVTLSSKKVAVRNYIESLREKIKERNLKKSQTAKTATKEIPMDYDRWENVFQNRKRNNATDFPFYSHDVARLEKIPPEIDAIFPTNFSNTTLLSQPPPRNFSFHNHPSDLIFKLDIFELLSRWDNLSLPFYSKFSRLKIDVRDAPIPRKCNVTPSSQIIEEFGQQKWKKFVECSRKSRKLTDRELDGNHILFTIRTSGKYHKKRLPLLFHTWLENVNRSNVVIVTDDVDPVLQYRATEAGIGYRISVAGYDKLCEKAGDEISLMFLPENQHYEWLCHVDDDMYVNLDRLVDVLANFKRDEPVYFGRAGSSPGKPRRVSGNATLGEPGTPYDFAVGGMYCLSRSLLDKARRWIGGRKAFGRMCQVTKEPEDVTVGFVVGILLGLELNQTKLIHGHGNDLYGINPLSLKHQVGISYGFGSVHWGYRPNNVVLVLERRFELAEDPSQFLSLHCHHHPTIGWCLH